VPSQPAVFAPDYAPEDIADIAKKLREAAGLPKEPTGEVANGKPQPRRRSSQRSSSSSKKRASTRAKAKSK
jgi:hypothetical protein